MFLINLATISKHSAKADFDKIVKQLSETSHVFKEQRGHMHFTFRTFHINLQSYSYSIHQ